MNDIQKVELIVNFNSILFKLKIKAIESALTPEQLKKYKESFSEEKIVLERFLSEVNLDSELISSLRKVIDDFS